jgi:hypothetical protein
MTKQDHVQACADTFAETEAALDAIKPILSRLHRQIADCVEAGVGKHSEGVRIRNGVENVHGQVAGALEKLLSLHAKCTTIANREGCDVPPGLAIDDGMVRPLEGGR